MSTMKAVVLEAPGPPEALQIRDLPIPAPDAGQVLIKVAAFGLNRSELHTRLGLAQGVTFPRVLGIEAVGTVAACPGGQFPVGQQVATLMGGMGRTFDGATPSTRVFRYGRWCRSGARWTGPRWAPCRRCCRRPTAP